MEITDLKNEPTEADERGGKICSKEKVKHSEMSN